VTTPSQPFAKLTRTRISGSVIKPVTGKRCPKFSGWLPLEAFSRDRRRHLGRSCWCRECAVAATRRWREENADLVKEMNERRRLGERQRDCVDCGANFTFKSAVAIRCPGCRRKRKRERAGYAGSVIATPLPAHESTVCNSCGPSRLPTSRVGRLTRLRRGRVPACAHRPKAERRR
jgi:hypothetical protein